MVESLASAEEGVEECVTPSGVQTTVEHNSRVRRNAEGGEDLWPGSWTSRLQELQPLLQPLPGLCRNRENLHTGPDGLDVPLCRRKVELGSCRQVHLGEDHHVRRVEDGRVLERLVLALRHREQYQAQILAEVVGCGTDQVPH